MFRHRSLISLCGPPTRTVSLFCAGLSPKEKWLNSSSVKALRLGARQERRLVASHETHHPSAALPCVLRRRCAGGESSQVLSELVWRGAAVLRGPCACWYRTLAVSPSLIVSHVPCTPLSHRMHFITLLVRSEAAVSGPAPSPETPGPHSTRAFHAVKHFNAPAHTPSARFMRPLSLESVDEFSELIAQTVAAYRRFIVHCYSSEVRMLSI